MNIAEKKQIWNVAKRMRDRFLKLPVYRPESRTYDKVHREYWGNDTKFIQMLYLAGNIYDILEIQKSVSIIDEMPPGCNAYDVLEFQRYADTMKLNLFSKPVYNPDACSYEVYQDDDTSSFSARKFVKAMFLAGNIYDVLLEKTARENIHNNLPIHEKNADARLKYLIKAYWVNDATKKSLSEMMTCYSLIYVRDLSSCDIYINQQTVQFIKWLKDDIRNFILEKFIEVTHSKYFYILKRRANGETLEEIGADIDLTRERVRQMEKKFMAAASKYFERYKPHYIMAAFSESPAAFDDEAISGIYGEYANIMRYIFQNVKSNDFYYHKEFNLYFYDDVASVPLIEQAIDEMPEIIKEDELNNAIQTAYQQVSFISYKIFNNLTLLSYKKLGRTYTKNRLSKAGRYRQIVEQYFPNGIAVYDKNTLNLFKKYYKREYGSELNADDRALGSRISDGLVLYGSGEYILPEKIRIDEDLLKDFRRYIRKNKKNSILYKELFQVFEDELLKKSNIRNEYFLHGTLKYHLSDEFIFEKSVVSKSKKADSSLRWELEKFIYSFDWTVTKRQILEEFRIEEYSLMQMIVNSKNIIAWQSDEYLHVSNLQINKDDISNIANVLNYFIADSAVHIKEIWEYLVSNNSRFLDKNAIDNSYSLFSVLEYLFSDKWTFSRPYVLPYGWERQTKDTLIRRILSDYDEISLTDFLYEAERQSIKIPNVNKTLQSVSDLMIRVDDDLLIKTSRLDIDESKIEIIEDIIIGKMGDDKYIRAADIEDFFAFPYIGISWTQHLLVSLIGRYSKRIKEIEYSSDYRYLRTVFIDAATGIENYKDFLKYVLRQNYISLSDPHKAEAFLIRLGLVTRLDKSFLEQAGF